MAGVAAANRIGGNPLGHRGGVAVVHMLCLSPELGLVRRLRGVVASLASGCVRQRDAWSRRGANSPSLG